MVKYQSVLQEAKIQEYHLSQVEKDRHLLILSFIFLIVLVFTVFFIIMYRKSNRLYTRIAKQYKKAITEKSGFQAKILELQSQIGTNKPLVVATSSSMTVNKSKELFTELEILMNDQKIFKDQNLDRDKLAKQLETNQKYLTRAISENSSKNFTGYINSYRIEEALKYLSDTSNDLPLKAICVESGFASMSTFYRIFQDMVGMSPAKYKERVRTNR